MLLLFINVPAIPLDIAASVPLDVVAARKGVHSGLSGLVRTQQCTSPDVDIHIMFLRQ